MKALRVPLALVALTGTLVHAQNTVTAAPVAETAADSTRRTPAQLEELLGPIALYPDALVALILPASTVPADLVLAARYLRDNPTLEPSQVEHRVWDESVKSLVRYPEVLRWMDENLDWTKQVGEAFVTQPAEVMQAMQRLRAKARAAGTLVDTPEQQVIAEENAIRIVPAQPDVIYVPRYDPEVVYVSQPAYSAWPYITFGIGFGVGSWLAYDCDWRYNTIWVGNPYRPWYGHNWRYPLIPPAHYPGRPGYAHGPGARPWRPPAFAPRPPPAHVGRPYAEIPRPAPIGAMAGSSRRSTGSITGQDFRSSPAGTAGPARSFTPGARAPSNSANGIWSSLPAAAVNPGRSPIGTAQTVGPKSRIQPNALYSAPPVAQPALTPLPNTVPRFPVASRAPQPGRPATDGVQANNGSTPGNRGPRGTSYPGAATAPSASRTPPPAATSPTMNSRQFAGRTTAPTTTAPSQASRPSVARTTPANPTAASATPFTPRHNVVRPPASASPAPSPGATAPAPRSYSATGRSSPPASAAVRAPVVTSPSTATTEASAPVGAPAAPSGGMPPGRTGGGMHSSGRGNGRF